ncbi:MAG: ribosome assembly RNA-binding protein YhbY [Gammaproteobacteria bacterium]|nr:ribosome assembly RNA-binding protein YhbY [Gammaproteobacteria bacterium]
MVITAAQKRFLRSKAHHLKPVVMVGQHGLSENVMNEVNLALDAHELIKVKLGAGDREEKKSILGEIISNSKAELIQSIGHVAVLFRRNHKKPKIELPRTKE